MGIKVIANSQGYRFKDLAKSTRKFGTTRFTGIRIRDIDLACSRIGKSNLCACRLTCIELDVCCQIRLNPKRIKGRFFDLDQKKAVEDPGETEEQRRRRPPLDEQSVLVHEKKHCDDIAEEVRSTVADALKKNARDFQARCLCTRRDLCLSQIRRLFQNRIAALARKAASDLSKKANAHRERRRGEDPGTEEKARDAQVQDYRDNPKREKRIQLPSKKEKDREFKEAAARLKEKFKAGKPPGAQKKSSKGPGKK